MEEKTGILRYNKRNAINILQTERAQTLSDNILSLETDVFL